MSNIKDIGFAGCGTIYLDPIDKATGQPTGEWVLIGEASAHEVKENTSTTERISGRCETRGQAVSSIVNRDPSELTIKFTSMNPDNFALLFLSEAVNKTVPAGTFDVPLLKTSHNSLARVPADNVLTLDVKSSDDATTYIEDTDYVIENKALGFIKILPDGGIADGAELHVSGTYGASEFFQMDGGTNVGRAFRVLMAGKNLDNDLPCTCETFSVVLAPQNGVDFLSPEFATGELTGKPTIDATEGASYRVKYNKVLGT